MEHAVCPEALEKKSPSKKMVEARKHKLQRLISLSNEMLKNHFVVYTAKLLCYQPVLVRLKVV